MKKKFEQLSIKPGYMKHNGGLLFKTISKKNMNLNLQLKKIILIKQELLMEAISLQ